MKPIRLFLLFYLLTSFVSNGIAQQTTQVPSDRFNISIALGDSLGVFEDLEFNLTLEEVMRQPFSSSFEGTDQPSGTYWVKFTLLNTTKNDVEVASLFDRTSFIDFFQALPNGEVFHAKSGGGRHKSEMNAEDDQKHIVFKLKAGVPSTIYFRFENHTDYLPDFGLRFLDLHSWAKEQEDTHLRDYLLFGAIIILVIYSTTLFIIHRYRPYFWLALHAFGLMMYSFVARDYLVDWLLPENPEFGIATPWALLGIFALLMLLSVFLKTKELHRGWHKLITVLKGLSLIQIVTSSIMMMVYGRFVLSTLINLLFVLVNVVLLVIMVFSLWKKLSKSQKAFAFGVLFFAGALCMAVISWLLIDSLGRTVATAISAIAPLGQILIFAIALGIEMRQHEVDKNVALDQLNTTLREQNQKIELEVIDRTKEISKQKVLLEERNDRIETLFKEVHHRVKNNLQLISSLLNMQQEWSSTEDPAKAIEDSRSRVVAMSMIHQFLYRTDDISTINFEQYAEELVRKIDGIQTKRVPYKLSSQFADSYIFDIDTSISLGLILNELVTNSYKHALVQKRELEMTIVVEAIEKGMYRLRFKDNGEAIAQPFKEVIKKGFGLRLAARLARQLQGDFSYQYESGNLFTIIFADEEARRKLTD